MNVTLITRSLLYALVCMQVTNQFNWSGMVVTKEFLARTARAAHHKLKHQQQQLQQSKQYAQQQTGQHAQQQLEQESSANNDNTSAVVASDIYPSWLPVTYDLAHTDELVMFIKAYILKQRLLLSSSATATNSASAIPTDSTMDPTPPPLTTTTTTVDPTHTPNATTTNTSTTTATPPINIWILKRYRGRQSIDYPITSSLSCALNHLDSAPRLACEYITTPVLYHHKKFDIRFYICILSLSPLIIYRYELFIIRCANIEYNIYNTEDYQKHFTLMCCNDMSDIRGVGERSDPSYIELINYFNNSNNNNNNNSGSGSGSNNEQQQQGHNHTYIPAHTSPNDQNYDLSQWCVCILSCLLYIISYILLYTLILLIYTYLIYTGI